MGLFWQETFFQRAIMTNVVLPFLMSMLLGRTIDLTTYTVGSNIYDDAQYVETPSPALAAKYQVLQDDNFPFTYFGIPADIVLRIKANYLSSSSGAMGLDGILKDTSWKYNSAILSVATLYKTVNRTLKADAQLLPDWKEKISPSQTHYANTLFYGGWFVVLFRFQCDIPTDVRAVRKTLTDTLGVVGELSNNTVALWNKAVNAINANEDIRGSVRVSSHIYSTGKITEDVLSPESLMKAIKSFPENVGPIGRPLLMDLKPLHDLDKRYPKVEENVELLDDLEKLIDMYDDVKVTKVSLMRWITETMAVFSEDDEDRIATLLNNLNECIRAFMKVSGDVSLFKPIDRNLLQTAFQKYKKGLEKGTSTYNLAYRRLKEEIDAECENRFLNKIKGLLKVYDSEMIYKGKVEGGLSECRRLCLKEEKCRAIGYGEQLSQLDLATGLYLKKEKQCWIYFRSTSTAIVTTPNGLSGEMFVYDRTCY